MPEHDRRHHPLEFARSSGKSIGDLSMQLDFMWKELTEGYPAVMVVLKEAETIREASDAVLLWYERPANQSESLQKKRASYGQKYYDKYAEKGIDSVAQGSLPYLVKVSIPDLNIRSGPGVSFSRTGQFTGKGVFTIVQEQDGWGRLKSGAGWICLKYTSRI